MARITVFQNGRSSLIVNLDTRELSLPNGKHRDATVFADENGLINAPKDLLDKIASGEVEVVDLYGLTLPGGTEIEQPAAAPVVEAPKGPKGKTQPKAQPAAAPVVEAPATSHQGSLLDLPNEEA